VTSSYLKRIFNYLYYGWYSAEQDLSRQKRRRNLMLRNVEELFAFVNHTMNLYCGH